MSNNRQKCECGEIMENLGNVSNAVYTSYPIQWDEVHVCHKCKLKKSIRCHEVIHDRINIDSYKEIGEKQTITTNVVTSLYTAVTTPCSESGSVLGVNNTGTHCGNQ